MIKKYIAIILLSLFVNSHSMANDQPLAKDHVKHIPVKCVSMETWKEFYKEEKLMILSYGVIKLTDKLDMMQTLYINNKLDLYLIAQVYQEQNLEKSINICLMSIIENVKFNTSIINLDKIKELFLKSEKIKEGK